MLAIEVMSNVLGYSSIRVTADVYGQQPSSTQRRRWQGHSGRQDVHF